MTVFVKRLTAVGVAAGAAALVWAGARLAGVDVLVRDGGSGSRPVGLVDVVLAVAVSGLLAVALVALLERLVRRPRAVWHVVAGSVLTLSVCGPASAAASVPAGVTLAALHVVVGGVLIWLLAPAAGHRDL